MDINDINIINSNSDRWLENVRANRRHFVKKQAEISGMVAFIIGAGPSLEKNVEQLKRIPKNSRGKIIACDVALPFLYENNIIPDICFSLDSKDIIWDMINSKTVDTSEIILVCGIMASPLMTDGWKGPKYFYLQKGTGYASKIANDLYMTSIIYKAKNNITKNDNIGIENLDILFSGIVPSIITGGNVSSAAYSWSNSVFNAYKIIFVGSDFSWENDEKYYMDGYHKEQGESQINTNETNRYKDINGNDVYTNNTLLLFKKWHEEYASVFPNISVNATEGGIFGVEADGKKISNSIKFMTLENSINKYVL